MEKIIIQNGKLIQTQDNGFNPFKENNAPFSSMVVPSKEFVEKMFFIEKYEKLNNYEIFKTTLGIANYPVEIKWGEYTPRGCEDYIKVPCLNIIVDKEKYFFDMQEDEVVIIQQRCAFASNKVELVFEDKSHNRHYCFSNFKEVL